MINIELQNFQELIRRIPEDKDVKKAAFRAINRTAQMAKTQAGREVAADYQVTGGKVARIAKIKRANSGSLTSEIRWKSPALPLEEWKTNPKRPNSNRKRRPILTARVFRSRVTKFKGVFIGKTASPRAYVRKGKNRFPIKRVYGPSLAQLVKADKVQERLTTYTNQKLQERFLHEANFIIRG